MKKILLLILSVFILKVCFSQQTISGGITVTPKTGIPTPKSSFINGIVSIDSAIRFPLRDNNWIPSSQGYVQWSPTQHGFFYYDIDSIKWLPFGSGSGGLPPSLANLYFDTTYFIIGVNPYNPYGTDQTLTINTDSIATVTYVNNFFSDTTYIFPYDAQQRTNTPPVSPADSTWWLVGNNPTGIWTGLANKLLQRIGSGYAPYDEPVSTVVNVLNPAQQWQRQSDGTWKLKVTFVINNGNLIRLPVFVGTQDKHGLGFITHDTTRFYIDSIGRKIYPEYINPDDTIYTVQLTVDPLTGATDTVHARNLYAVTPLRLSNDTLYCDGCTEGGGIELQTNGVDNGSQTKLNLVAGTNVTLTDNGTGSVTIDATGGSGSVDYVKSGVGILVDSSGRNYTVNVDTNFISTRAWRQKGIDSVQANVNLKLNISDTASMLSPYFRSINNPYVTMTLAPDSSYVTFNHYNGNKDTLRVGAGTVTGGSIAWPGTLYSTPTTGTVSSGVLTFSPSLASQSAWTVFGRFAGTSGTPSFGQLKAENMNTTYTNNYVLKTDGSGNLSWVAQSGGGSSPAGNYGDVQLNRNSAFATPASDSLIYTTSGGLVIKNSNTAFSFISNGSTATNGNFKIIGNSSTNNLSAAWIQPNSGTNVGSSLTATGLGTGFPQAGKDTIKSQLAVSNTDLNADATNYSTSAIRGTGVNGTGWVNITNGSGVNSTLRPLYINSLGTETKSGSNMFFNTDGKIGILNVSPSYQLDITGDLRTTSNAYFATSSGGVSIGTTTSSGALNVSGADANFTSGNINILTNGKYLTIAGASSSQGYKLTTTNVTSNFASGAFYPTAGTNTAMSFNIYPLGTGYSSTIKAQLAIYNTDGVADATNYSSGVFRASGTDGFGIFTFKGGTGTLYPFWIDATGSAGSSTANIVFNTDGTTKLKAPSTNSETSPALLIRNATSGNIEKRQISFGQTTLVSGTKAITVTGLGTGSIATVTVVSIGGTVTTTWQYKAVCTANTLTITAIDNTGATNTSDTSVLNYSVVF